MKLPLPPIPRSGIWKMLQVVAVLVTFGLFSCFLYTTSRESMLPAASIPHTTSSERWFNSNEVVVAVSKEEYQYSFIIPNERRCENENRSLDHVDLVLIIKSAVNNSDRRDVIRRTWGLEHRFSMVVIRRIFNLGFIEDHPEIQQKVLEEQTQYGDIVQSAFLDNYYNNTIKTLMGMRWISEFCPTAKFIMFADDDMYISVKNVLRFVNHPHKFPKYYLQRNDPDNSTIILNPSESEMNDTNFYAGFRMDNFGPHRDQKSKWYISTADYPFDKYPPFLLAGAFIMSYRTLQKMYLASKHTKRLPFDDVYLGLVARAAGIYPIHNEHFVNWRQPQNYRFVLSTHLYGDTKKLQSLWNKYEPNHYV